MCYDYDFDKIFLLLLSVQYTFKVKWNDVVWLCACERNNRFVPFRKRYVRIGLLIRLIDSAK